ncbi:hypothetical protein [Chitinasiproducens palmae]|uniref:Uncharacterized protein n=1 Tax=Chitinasiproducens palmae TaxID=1770053 RepID=A0A1H2PRW2_9BURK|nr:hypothetical protein [Chitinasiproducens palmae]SDV49675.1 hypothetical protein SAMN05216551_10940 [Chitinasiproducens palmae]
MKIASAVIVVTLSMASFGVSAKNTFEDNRRWSFEKDGELTVDTSYDGLDVGCFKFSPERVNFYVELINEPTVGRLPLSVEQTGGTYTGGGKFHHVNGAKTLRLTFYPGNRYRVRNETGEAVLGLECDRGTAPIAASASATQRQAR